MTFVEDLEKLIGWRMEYLLANRNVRNYITRLRTENYCAVCSEIFTNGDKTPEFLLFKSLCIQLYQYYRKVDGSG